MEEINSADQGLAEAACTDPPGEAVNWQRCSFDGLDLSGVDLAKSRLRDGSFLRANLAGADLTEFVCDPYERQHARDAHDREYGPAFQSHTARHAAASRNTHDPAP